VAITCPRCGSEFDATLFQFGHRVRCRCGAEIEYPGTDQRGGHVLAQDDANALSHEGRCVGCLLGILSILIQELRAAMPCQGSEPLAGSSSQRLLIE
jgi:hypothetical protein